MNRLAQIKLLRANGYGVTDADWQWLTDRAQCSIGQPPPKEPQIMTDPLQALRAFIPAESWPAVLPPEDGEDFAPLPLAIGIKHDLGRLTDGSPQAMSAVALALELYTATPAYLEAVARPGSLRHDITGKAVAAVLSKHRAFAAKRLDPVTCTAADTVPAVERSPELEPGPALVRSTKTGSNSEPVSERRRPVLTLKAAS